jgi:hypothetical protein
VFEITKIDDFSLIASSKPLVLQVFEIIKINNSSFVPSSKLTIIWAIE